MRMLCSCFFSHRLFRTLAFTQDMCIHDPRHVFHLAVYFSLLVFGFLFVLSLFSFSHTYLSPSPSRSRPVSFLFQVTQSAQRPVTRLCEPLFRLPPPRPASFPWCLLLYLLPRPLTRLSPVTGSARDDVCLLFILHGRSGEETNNINKYNPPLVLEVPFDDDLLLFTTSLPPGAH